MDGSSTGGPLIDPRAFFSCQNISHQFIFQEQDRVYISALSRFCLISRVESDSICAQFIKYNMYCDEYEIAIKFHTLVSIEQIFMLSILKLYTFTSAQYSYPAANKLPTINMVQNVSE